MTTNKIRQTRKIGTPKIGGGAARKLRRWQHADRLSMQVIIRKKREFPNGRPIKYTAGKVKDGRRVDVYDYTHAHIGCIVKNPQRPTANWDPQLGVTRIPKTII